MPTQMNLPTLVAEAVLAELARNPERYRSVTPGPKGDSVTIDSVRVEADHSLTLEFSDGTTFNTPPIRGDRGPKGVQGELGPRGVGVHHTRWTATTNPEHHFGVAGHMDTYTLYGDEDELAVLGWFSVKNGEDGKDSYDYAVEGGYEGTKEEFYKAIAENATNIEQIQNLVDQIEHLFALVDGKGQEFIDQVNQIIADFLVVLDDKARVVVRANNYLALPANGEEDKLYLVVDDETIEGRAPGGVPQSTLYHWLGYAYAPVGDSRTASNINAILVRIAELEETKADKDVFEDVVENINDRLAELDDKKLDKDVFEDAVENINDQLAELNDKKLDKVHFEQNKDVTDQRIAELETELQSVVQGLEDEIQQVASAIAAKEVVEVEYYSGLPQEGAPGTIYVVLRDECRRAALSFYYWAHDRYWYFADSFGKASEGPCGASNSCAACDPCNPCGSCSTGASAGKAEVWNTTSATITTGTPVMLSRSMVDNVPGVVPMLLSDAEVGSKYVGIATRDILPNTKGEAAHIGVVRCFDTTAGSRAWTVGDALYFSGDGSAVISNLSRTGSAQERPIGYVLHVSPQEGVIYLSGSPFGGSSDSGSGTGGGEPGRSAYEIAVIRGFVGTEVEWLASLVGPAGPAGKSAYESAVDNGYQGTEQEWAEVVNGKDGKDGKSAYELAQENGFTGTEQEWLETAVKGADGKSAYELAQEDGFTGTLTEWLESVKGERGTDGTDGKDGKSAYEIAVDNGFVGTEQEWLDSATGGADGKSAYELAQENGFTGTLQEWLSSIAGAPGADGKSAYDVAVDNGFVGSEQEWLNTIVKGADGKDGKDGKSAYELAVENGYTGTLTEWLAAIGGNGGGQGARGASAYEVAVEDGFVGTRTEWLESLKNQWLKIDW